MRISIATKIFIVLSIFLAETLLLVPTFYHFNRSHDRAMSMHRAEDERLDLINSLQLVLGQVIMPANDFLVAGGDLNEPENFKRLDAKANDLIKKIDKLGFETKKESELFDYIKQEYSKINDIAQKIFSIPNAARDPQAGRLMEQLDEIADEAIIATEGFHWFANSRIENTNIASQKTKRSLDIIIGLAVISNAIIIVLTGIFLKSSIISPLGVIKEAALEIGRGNLNKKININTKDEIEELASSFNEMTKDLKQTQEALVQSEKLTVVGEFASGIAHDIRNPLMVINGRIELLESEDLPVDITEKMNIIKKQTQHIQEMVNRLLSYSKKSKLDIKALNINELIKGMPPLLSFYPDFKKIEWKEELQEKIPQVRGDFNQLQEVFINLALNAIQAIVGKGSITVETIYNSANNEVMVIVRDTGPGIDRENIQKMFDPFFTTKEKGTGLGLAICRKIIDMHKGKIEVESTVGKGTTFTIKLPC